MIHRGVNVLLRHSTSLTHPFVRRFSILKIGIDEAGRGAVLGPLVISSLLLDECNEEELRSAGIRDSKQMTPENRFKTYDLILDKSVRSISMHISAITIDKQRKLGLSMNCIEENHIFDLLKRYQNEKIDTVIIDAFVSKKNRLEKETIKLFPKSNVLCEFHADANHISVAAASVIAKVERDRAMMKLSEEVGMNLGTGYPHDPLSINYIRSYVKEYKKAPLIARTSWLTTQRILEEELK